MASTAKKSILRLQVEIGILEASCKSSSRVLFVVNQYWSYGATLTSLLRSSLSICFKNILGMLFVFPIVERGEKNFKLFTSKDYSTVYVSFSQST